MVLCLFCHTDGKNEVRNIPQKQVSVELGGGSVTFVGAFPHHELVAVALRDATDAAKNPLSRLLEEEVKGTIVLVRSDKDGNECDVDVQSVCEFLELGV